MLVSEPSRVRATVKVRVRIRIRAWIRVMGLGLELELGLRLKLWLGLGSEVGLVSCVFSGVIGCATAYVMTLLLLGVLVRFFFFGKVLEISRQGLAYFTGVLFGDVKWTWL